MSSELTVAHIEAQARLRKVTIASVERIWDDLPGYDRENVDEWLSKVLPVVRSSQRTAVSLTEAYLARFLDRPPLGVDRNDLIGAAARNGADPAVVYERPFVTLWSALGAGTSYEDAVSKGLERAKSTAAMDDQLAMRAASDAVEDVDTGIYGFQRVADSGACDFCLEVDGAYVKAADGIAMSLHNFCGCGLEPLTEPHAGAVLLPDGSRIRDYQYGPVKVQQHGELGPVLTDPAHNFTSESDL